MSSEEWLPDLGSEHRARYVAIAEAIGADIASGRLRPGDRLPPQRRIAQRLGLDVASISRGYAEAARRGYIEAHVGRGTFVREAQSETLSPDPRRILEEDPRMNMPPEPDDPRLIARMQEGLNHVAANIVPLLRYQTPTGSNKDREIAEVWLHANGMSHTDAGELAITPGSHAAIHAALSVLRKPETVVLCEHVTYSGIRAIASRLNLPLMGLEEDEHGITPEALDAAIRSHKDAILYLNPTLRNPTTQTIPSERRAEIAETLRKHRTRLIEDDAYCFVSTDAPPPISTILPELGWHIAGISKVFGAGLRLAYVRIPEPALVNAFVQAIRTICVMTSPVSLALLSHWMENGTAAELQAFVRTAARARQQVAQETLAGLSFRGHPDAFNIWLSLPEGFSRAEVLARLSGRQIGIIPSDVFIPSGPAPETLRVCLGGPVTLPNLQKELWNLRETLLQKDWVG